MDEVQDQGYQVTVSQEDRSDPHDKDPICDLCAKSEQVTSASGYCQNCHEFLCSACILSHKKFKVLKHHTLLEGEHMPNERPTIVNVEKCSKHPDMKVNVYCSDEEDIGCTLCFIEGHRKCNVGLISTILEKGEQSDYIEDTQKESKKQTVLLNKLRGKLQVCRLKNEEYHASCLEDFRTFRAEIEAVLDVLGEEISQEADKLQKENTEKLNNLEEMISSHELQLESCMQEIDRLAHNQQHLDQLFITVKKSKKRIIENIQQLEQLSDSTHVSEYYVDFDDSIKPSLEKMKQPATKCTDVSKVYVQSPEDTEDCTFRGILVIAETKLFVTDFRNKCLKLIDIESKSIIQRRTLPSAPWDITELPGTRIAVALVSSKQILFFTADQNMSPCGGICVTGKCSGLYCTQNRLFVAIKPPDAQIQVLSLEGQVLQSIQHDLEGCNLFNFPMYLTLDSKNHYIYVSDHHEHTVLCLNTSGVVQWVYDDEELENPAGVETGDDGCLYICSRKNHSIHVVSCDGTRLAVITQSESELRLPEAVFYSSLNRTLYVSCGGADSRNYISRLRLQ